MTPDPSRRPLRRAIVAMARNRVIGNHGQLPWKLEGELPWVREVTRGGSLVMGRATWQSIGRPLPGRFHLIVSRTQPDPGLPEVRVIRSLYQLDAALPPERPVWIFGGAELYAQLLPTCDELYLTDVDLAPAGDTLFPPFEHLFAPAEVLRSGPGWTARRWTRRTPD